MESSNKAIFTKPRQYEVMVDFMVAHADLAKSHLNVANAKSKSKDLWQRLSKDLDAVGPPYRELEKWKKVWADYKQHVKVKCRKNASGISGTGGGPSNFCSLTPLEQRVSELLSINSSVSGMRGTFEFGVKANTAPATSSIDADNQQEDERLEAYLTEASDEPSLTSAQKRSITSNTYTPRKRSHLQRENLLQKQVDNQIGYQEASLQILKESNINQKHQIEAMTEVIQNLVATNKYLRRNCDWKERQFKLAKEKFEFKKKHENEKFEFKKKKQIEKTKHKLAQLELKNKIFELKWQKSGFVQMDELKKS